MKPQEKIVETHDDEKDDRFLTLCRCHHALLIIANHCGDIYLSDVNDLIVKSLSMLSILSTKTHRDKESLDVFLLISDETKTLVIKRLDRDDHAHGIYLAINAIFESVCRGLVAVKTLSKDSHTEKQLQEMVVKKWDEIPQFSNYAIVKQYFKTHDGDMVDILATDRKTGNPVLIELKKHNKTGHKQLRSYANEFKKPILINVSESITTKKAKGVIYFTFDDLLRS
jgi:hypothetical protein